jgi:hypothetical protein
MYGNTNEADLIFSRCDRCGRKVKLNELLEKYSDVDMITWFDGTLKPKLYLYCEECYGKE